MRQKRYMYTQDKWLLDELLRFFHNNPEHLETLKKIINREYVIYKKKKLSIRIVYWFVTNFAKQHFTVYNIPSKVDGEDSKRFFVWTNYKSTEDSYTKQMFDPYCRQERIFIQYTEDSQIETTIGQLHFFKWAILNKVLDYIIANFEEIEKDMATRLNTPKRKGLEDVTSNGKTRKKREELSTNACRSLKKEICFHKVVLA